MITDKLRKVWRFFHANAGWATPPGKAACALNLARAEAWAEEEGVKVKWVWDDCPWEPMHDGEKPPEEWLGCILTHGDESASLWGIGDPDADYRRVVEADLALELQTCMFEAIAQRIGQL